MVILHIERRRVLALFEGYVRLFSIADGGASSSSQHGGRWFYSLLQRSSLTQGSGFLVSACRQTTCSRPGEGPPGGSHQ